MLSISVGEQFSAKLYEIQIDSGTALNIEKQVALIIGQYRDHLRYGYNLLLLPMSLSFFKQEQNI